MCKSIFSLPRLPALTGASRAQSSQLSPPSSTSTRQHHPPLPDNPSSATDRPWPGRGCLQSPSVLLLASHLCTRAMVMPGALALCPHPPVHVASPAARVCLPSSAQRVERVRIRTLSGPAVVYFISLGIESSDHLTDPCCYVQI